jgi:hypothetical protein
MDMAVLILGDGRLSCAEDSPCLPGAVGPGNSGPVRKTVRGIRAIRTAGTTSTLGSALECP